MASPSIALVNRLRLGEPPSAADCALAARLLALDSAAGDLIDLADDIYETVEGDATARKLRVRLAVLTETARVLEGAIESAFGALQRYFSLRADVEGDDDQVEDLLDLPDLPDLDADVEPEGIEALEGAAAVGSSLAGALADLAVNARVGEALDVGLQSVRADCQRLRTGLVELLSNEPDTEASLDFLSGVEADMQHALWHVLRSDLVEGEQPFRPGLAELASAALETR